MLLALDTCFNACSAALFDDAAGLVVASAYQEMERGHAEALGPMVERLFATTRITPAQLSRIAVTFGPGTFTGLRIGLSFAKGMALALDIPLLGIDSLTATACQLEGRKNPFIIAHKAGGTGLFYWARYDGETTTQPALGSAEEIALAAGGNDAEVLYDVRLNAKDFAAYTATLPVSGEPVEPLYLRPPDAKPSASPAASTAQVRVATPHDVETMADIHCLSFPRGWNAKELSDTLSIPGSGALVVELAGTLYGFVQFQWVAGEAEINTICVSPNYRRQHFGRDLLEGLLAQLKRLHTQKIFLEVSANNNAGLGLYQAHGFQRSGLRKAYYSDGSDAITMVKVLAS